MKKKLTPRALPALATLTAAAAICATQTARADDTPPANSVRAGMYAIFYHVKADDVSGPYTPPGVNIDVKDTQTAYFAYVRRFTSYLDLELAFGVPPKTDTVGRGPQKVGSVLTVAEIQSIVASQLALEASVAPSPPAQLTVKAQPGGVVSIGIAYWDAKTGVSVSFTITS